MMLSVACSVNCVLASVGEVEEQQGVYHSSPVGDHYNR